MFISDIANDSSRMFYLEAIQKLEDAGFTVKSHYVEATMGGHFYTEEYRLQTIDITSNTVNAVKIHALLAMKGLNNVDRKHDYAE